jgi:hypothetical protein
MGKLNKHSGSMQADHLSDRKKSGDKKTTLKTGSMMKIQKSKDKIKNITK